MAEFEQKAASPRHAPDAAPRVVSGQAGPSSDGGLGSAGAGLGRLRVALNQSPRAQAAAQLSRSLNPHPNRGVRAAHVAPPIQKPVAALPRERGDSSVAQRLIALDVKPNVEMQEDMPALKVLAQLKHFLKDKLSDSQVFLLDERLNFSGMSKNETLYIAGHGTPGALYGVQPDALLKMLNDPDKGVPAHIGQITFLVCNAGTREVEQVQDSSLVSQIAMGLRHPNIVVAGAKGYTFGAPGTAERGLNRVMPVALWEIEKATDEDEIAEKLSGMPMTDELRAAARRSQEANQDKVGGASTVGEAFDSRDQLVKHSKRFFDRKLDLEERLNEAVTAKQPGQQAAATAVNSVVTGLKDDPGFGQLVTEQNALYEEFGFFHQQDEYERKSSLGQSAALKDPAAHKLFLNSLSWGERMQIGRDVNQQAYDNEIGAALQLRFLKIVDLCSLVIKQADQLIVAVESVGPEFATGPYQHAGQEQLKAIGRAKLASAQMYEIVTAKGPGDVFGRVSDLETLRKAIRSPCLNLKENNQFKGVMTFLSAQSQQPRAEEIGHLSKALESSATELTGTLDITGLDSALNDWIHKYAR